MSPLLFVYNAGSGTHKEVGLQQRIGRILGNTPFEFCAFSELDQWIDRSSWRAVVAIGGDGTVNAVGERCAKRGLVLGVIPRGSGDGLARHIGMPHSLEKALDVILEGKICRIDTAFANDHFFINMAGTGFEAFVAHRFAQARKRGLMSYVDTVRKAFLNYQKQEARIETEGMSETVRFFSLSLANGSQWGNEFKIASAANLRDGQLELVLMDKPKWHQVTALIRYLRSNRQEDRPWIRHRRVQELIVSSNETHWHVDGEPVELESPVHIRVHPASLDLISAHG